MSNKGIKVQRFHACEWCDEMAKNFVRSVERKDYVRYACNEHIEKTERLCNLDIGPDAERVRGCTNTGWPVEN